MYDGFLKSGAIKSALRSQLPANKNISKHHVWNVRLKVKRLIPQLKNIESFQQFQSQCNTMNLHVGLDNTKFTDDDIALVGKEIWSEIMSDTSHKDSLVTFVEYMQILADKNRGFTYQMLQDQEGKYSGCVWQTATMRDNFERFGSMISIDAMKREINTFNWPYIAISMYNELEQLCVGCEGIVCTERAEAYKALVRFCTDNSPKRSRAHIYVLGCDGLVCQEMVTYTFELPNAHFVLDQWHLCDSILPHRLGRFYFDKISGHLKLMINASSLDNFSKAYNNAMSILHNLPNRNVNAENELTNFMKEKDHYASFVLSKKRSTRGKHGSSISESNHSSVLVWLNDGDKYGNKYTEEPHTLVKDLFLRQQLFINKWNQQLYNEWLQLQSEIKTFNDSIPQCLKQAIEHHCLVSYLRFKIRASRLHEYSVENITPTHKSIQSERYPTASPRNCFKVNGSKYFVCNNCEGSIAYEEQCEHSLLSNNNNFVKSQFHIRHIRREKQEGSYLHNNNHQKSIDKEQMSMLEENIYEAFETNDEVGELSHWENITVTEESRGKVIKPLSTKDLQNIFNDILSKVDRCQDNVKFLVSSLAISMQKVSDSDGKHGGILESCHQSDGEVLKEMKRVIDNHSQSFLPKKNEFLPSHSDVDTTIVRPSHSQQKRKNFNRLMPVHEKQRKKYQQASGQVKVNSTVKRFEQPTRRSCTFCGSTKNGETRITQCPKKSAFTTIAVEYDLGGNYNGFSKLCFHMEHKTNLRKPEKLQPSFLQSMKGRITRGKHIFIFNVWKEEISEQESKFDGLCFEFALINKSGMVGLPMYQMHGHGFYQILTSLNQLTKRTLVYDGTKFAPQFLQTELISNSLIEEHVPSTELPKSSQMSQSEATIQDRSQTELSILSQTSQSEAINNTDFTKK